MKLYCILDKTQVLSLRKLTLRALYQSLKISGLAVQPDIS